MSHNIPDLTNPEAIERLSEFVADAYRAPKQCGALKIRPHADGMIVGCYDCGFEGLVRLPKAAYEFVDAVQAYEAAHTEYAKKTRGDTMNTEWVSEWSTYRGPVIVIQPDQSVVRGEMINAEPHRSFCVIRFNPRAPLGRVHPKWVRPDEWAPMAGGEA